MPHFASRANVPEPLVSTPEDLARHGWTPVPRDAKDIFQGQPFLHEPRPMILDETPFHSDTLVIKVKAYAKEHLAPATFNHSMRVYHFAHCILTYQFPEHLRYLSLSTLALACMLHDIGTTDENLHATLLSFEFYGGILSLNLLTEYKAPPQQAEAVCEAIIRHQDLGTVGRITFLGQLLQIATIYDNLGAMPDLVHAQTRNEVVARYPRLGWSTCFARTIRQENELKPWAHTTHLGEEEFPAGVLGNELMREYEWV
jgi:cyanamide hydratase